MNVVLATDIFDPELNDLRKKRWNQAFSECGPSAEANNARATVVIEHIMQASDVCHTMQHWHVYKRFNQKLFEELMVAYRQGRCAANPIDFWYEGELKFFDNYVSVTDLALLFVFLRTHIHSTLPHLSLQNWQIIPLANKLKDCNIFGVSSDECLNFAVGLRSKFTVNLVHCMSHIDCLSLFLVTRFGIVRNGRIVVVSVKR